jgi:hypothetical protein
MAFIPNRVRESGFVPFFALALTTAAYFPASILTHWIFAYEILFISLFVLIIIALLLIILLMDWYFYFLDDLSKRGRWITIGAFIGWLFPVITLVISWGFLYVANKGGERYTLMRTIKLWSESVAAITSLTVPGTAIIGYFLYIIDQTPYL